MIPPRVAAWLARAPVQTVVACGVLAVAAVALFLSAWRDLPVAPSRLAAVGLAAVALLVVVRLPGPALVFLICFIPWQGFLFALAYRFGAPAAVLRPLGGVKEVITVGLLLLALSRIREDRWDALDALAGIFVLLVAAGLVLPSLLPDAFPPVGWQSRFLGFRQEALFAVLFIGARHAGLDKVWRSRAMVGLVVVTVPLLFGGIWENVSASSFNRFMRDTVQIGIYHAHVLNDTSLSGHNLLIYSHFSGLAVVRVGSFLINPLVFGFLLVLPFSIAAARILRRSPGWWPIPVLVGTGVCLIFTLTRSAILSGLVAGLVLAFLGQRHLAIGRTRWALLVAIGILAALPLMASSHLISRTTDALGGTDPSAQLHRSRTTEAVSFLIDHPLGSGLGTGAGVGQHVDSGGVVPENSYLQVGTIDGVPSMVVFVVLLVATVRELGRRIARDWAHSYDFAALLAATVGLSVGAFFLQVWLSLVVSIPFWGLVGMGLAARRRSPAAHPIELPPRTAVPATTGQGARTLP